MKVICNRGALLEALMVAGNVAATRTTKQVLQCVKLSAEGSELTVSATDLEVFVSRNGRSLYIASSRSGAIWAPQLTQIPYVPFSMRASARSASACMPRRW